MISLPVWMAISETRPCSQLTRPVIPSLGLVKARIISGSPNGDDFRSVVQSPREASRYEQFNSAVSEIHRFAF